MFIAHSLGGLVVKQVRGIGISNQHLDKIAITFDRSNADGKELLQAICKSMQPFQECIAQLGQALAFFKSFKATASLDSCLPPRPKFWIILGLPFFLDCEGEDH